ncbi:MAG: winged helix-turn-helix transcriptional regulator [Methylophilaceae bacterium]|uniref:winged helix-turn-helix transcriptional regulator n=1 Tax=Methylibium sp. TaxID=2067992 RepID=UPI00359A8178
MCQRAKPRINHYDANPWALDRNATKPGGSAQTLQWLEDDGLVERKSYPVVPPHVEYSLSPMGVEAAQQVRSLADWIEENVDRIVVAQKGKPRAKKETSLRALIAR